MWKRLRLQQVFTNLHLEGIYIPFFQKVIRTPAGGFSIIIKLRTGMTATRIMKKSEAIAIGMKAAEVTLERIRGHKFRLSVRTENERVLPIFPAKNGELGIPEVLTSIPFGVNADGYQVRLPLFSKSGGSVTLIGGNPGQGKSSAVKIILAGCVGTNSCVIWFDPKSGADANPYKDRVEVVSDPKNPGQFLEYLVRIQELIFQRNQIISQGYDISVLPRVVLFIDEWALLTALGTKQEQQLIQTEIRNLAATGRSANVSLVLATQRPTSVNIDVATRELSNNRVAFLVGDTHASEAILGQTGAESKTNPLSPGQALVWLDGLLQRTTIYEVPEQLTTWCKNAAGYKITLQEAEERGEIFRRECGIEEF
jgi:S-DNA-T family DNA segregation ATPase FtsK/SpoIIIE